MRVLKTNSSNKEHLELIKKNPYSRPSEHLLCTKYDLVKYSEIYIK